MVYSDVVLVLEAFLETIRSPLLGRVDIEDTEHRVIQVRGNFPELPIFSSAKCYHYRSPFCVSLGRIVFF
jgi:hypothetical protein